MASFEPTPAQLTVRLTLYFAIIFGAMFVTLSFWPNSVDVLPLGGHHALNFSAGSDESFTGVVPEITESGSFTENFQPDSGGILKAIIFLSLHLSGTVLLMIPIAWSYMATRRDIGYHKNFARALIVMPICATTIVLLIQDSLSLAFGLAALVAAVRFRMALEQAIDGVFIFAAICVGLAAGVGYLGIAAVLAVFFCFTVVILWHLDFGMNPLDEATQEKKRAKLSRADNPPATQL